MKRWLVRLICLTALAAHAAGADWPGLVKQLETARGPALADLKAQLIAGGMAAHEALIDGAAGTAAVRAEIRKSIRARRDVAARKAGLVMHEWGAVSYTQGLDDPKVDLPLDGAADLPEFVQVWGKLAKEAAANNNGGGGGVVGPGNVRIEIIKKPIVYFYSDRAETITFTVACPRGLLTEWYPKAGRVTPDPQEAGGSLDVAAALAAGGGMLTWKNLEVKPGPADFPPVPAKATWWPICRDTDSTPINVDGVWEKFLFYRGLLADVPPVLRVEGGANFKYTLTNTAKEPVRHVLVVRVDGNKATAKFVPAIKAGESRTVELPQGPEAQDAAAFAEETRARLAEALEEAGLFPKEAAGMTKIWRKEWFEADGVRLIYLNPPGATSSLMPVRVDPAPAESVRTLLIAVECLRDSRENVIKRLIAELGDGEFGVREAAQRRLILMGAAVEPALRQTLSTATDEEVLDRVRLILSKLNPRNKVDAAEPPEPVERFDR